VRIAAYALERGPLPPCNSRPATHPPVAQNLRSDFWDPKRELIFGKRVSNESASPWLSNGCHNVNILMGVGESFDGIAGEGCGGLGVVGELHGWCSKRVKALAGRRRGR
jgi:hypothetical protein